MKVLKEWFVKAPWGDIALISWGNPAGEPILLVHGRQDSVATFIPLLEYLPDKYNYVGVDMPGNGKSQPFPHVISWGNPAGEPILLVHGRQDSVATFIPLLEYLPDKYNYVGVDMPGNGKSQPFPHGVKLTRFHFIGAVEFVIEHLKWTRFVYIGHSMGCEQGLFYNAVYPGRIKKMVHLDLGPSLQRLQVHDPVEYYKYFYDQFYSDYLRENLAIKLYTKEEAIDAVKQARGLTEEQAEMILSRNLIHVKDHLYRLSWDRRLRTPAPQNFPVDFYYKLFSKNAPPTLLLASTKETSNPYSKGKKEATEIINRMQNNLKNFTVISIEGGHDVHFTNPERLAKYVKDFLEKDFGEPQIESEKLNEDFGDFKDLSVSKL